MTGRDIFLITCMTLFLMPVVHLLSITALAYWRRRRGARIIVECNCGDRFIFRFTREGAELPANDFTQRRLGIHRACCPDVP